ncbi:TIGR04283 family arsenosugar biosynthesis glycosyltransferase [Eionea flava]
MVVPQGKAVVVAVHLLNAGLNQEGSAENLVHLSIIIPVLNEEEGIRACLHHLCLLSEQYPQYLFETIVVDGGSHDDTVATATLMADVVVTSDKGRAKQMNVGAQQAAGRYLLFLHSDTQFPLSETASSVDSASQHLLPFLDNQGSEKVFWGFYPVRLSGRQRLLRVVETMMNVRSRLTSIATGDQCIFVKSDVFNALGGFNTIPLMEDVEFSKRLRQRHPPFIPCVKVTTDSRRWEKYGVIKTILLMWYLRALYFFGVNPTTLARYYYR